MTKNKTIHLGMVFSAVAIMTRENPEMFDALVQYWVEAAQRNTPPWKRQAHSMNSQHTAEALRLTRNR